MNTLLEKKLKRLERRIAGEWESFIATRISAEKACELWPEEWASASEKRERGFVLDGFEVFHMEDSLGYPGEEARIYLWEHFGLGLDEEGYRDAKLLKLWKQEGVLPSDFSISEFGIIRRERWGQWRREWEAF